MTPENKQLVQDTWKSVMPIAETAAALFYGRLFELDPALRPMFAHSDMKEQGKKLMQMLTVAVKGLDRLDELVPAVEALGRRHVGYGVTDAHYETVGSALLWTLGKGLGDAWSPAAEAAWTETYVTLSTVMRRAAGAVPAPAYRPSASGPAVVQ
jgi:hemoglobin-like flavoprotein